MATYESDEALESAYAEDYPHEAAANAILQLRADLGWTQAQLADRVGTTQSVIARAESGRHTFQIALLDRIARATDSTWRPVFVPRHVSITDLASNVVPFAEYRRVESGAESSDCEGVLAALVS